MNISVNGERREVTDGTTLYDVLCSLSSDPPPKGVAIALNWEVVPRVEWRTTAVAEADVLEVLWASSGG